MFFREVICQDSLDKIEEFLPVHKLTNPTWHALMASTHLSKEIDEMINLASNEVAQQEYLKRNKLPTGNGYSYEFEGTWGMKYQVYKYTEILDSIRYVSSDAPCPYSLELKVYPSITGFYSGPDGRGSRSPVISQPTILRILFKSGRRQTDDTLKARWQNAYQQTPDAIVIQDSHIYEP